MQSICFKCGNPTKSGKTIFLNDGDKSLLVVCRDCKIKYYPNKEVKNGEQK